MSYVIHGFLCACIGMFVSIGAQPIFPDGISSITKSVSARQNLVSSTTDDKAKVDVLMRGGSAALQEDLLEASARRDLEQVRPVPFVGRACYNIALDQGDRVVDCFVKVYYCADFRWSIICISAF